MNLVWFMWKTFDRSFDCNLKEISSKKIQQMIDISIEGNNLIEVYLRLFPKKMSPWTPKLKFK